MAYNKYDYDKQVASYMDGIPVKISEQYKPPKKITLPGAVINKLNAEPILPEYNFTLEKSIMDKMSQWRQLRQSQREARKERLEAEKQTRLSTDPVEMSPSKEPAANPPATPYSILTPVPIHASTHSQSTNYPRSFNISDFEQDTASPFDNMELKTINDLEELAHVLQPTVISDINECGDSEHKKNPPPRLNGLNTPYGYNNGIVNWTSSHSNVVHPNWYQEPRLPQYPCHPQAYVVQRLDVAGKSSQSVPDIVQQLEMELRGKREAESQKHKEQPQRPASIGPSELSGKSSPRQVTCEKSASTSPNLASSLPNPYSQLSAPCQQLANRLAEMGFPLPRVARAAERFGNDEPRIIEFLVQVQRLEEMKYPPDRAERALITNNFKETDTVEFLNTLSQLLDLGFREDQVERALTETGLDRDKALDLLVS